MGCIIFEGNDLIYKNSNYIAQLILGTGIIFFSDIISEDYLDFIKNNTHDNILHNISFIKNNKKIFLDIRVIKVDNKLIILIYDFFLIRSSYDSEDKSLNDYTYNIEEKIINYNFSKILSDQYMEIILSYFYVIITESKKFKILYINDNFRNLIKRNNIYDIKNNINNIKICEPIDIEINNITIKVIVKKFNNIIYIISYDGLNNNNHINNILHNLYSEKTIKYIENGLLPPSKTYENITILFLDIIDFSKKCEKMSSKNVTEWMTNFHNIIQKNLKKYQITRIETKGDNYLCVSGLNIINNDDKENQVTRMIDFSIKIIEELTIINTYVRIGINYGEATISYISNFDFIPSKTVYGNDVNIAARMEQTGKNGLIHMTKTAAEKYTDENNMVLDKTKINYISYKNLINIETYYYDPYLNDFTKNIKKFYLNKSCSSSLS